MAQSHEHVGIKISAKIKIYILSRAKSLCSLCHEIPCNVYLTKKSTETYMTWLLIKYYSIVVSSKLYDKVDSLHLKNSVTSVTFHMLLHFRAVPLEFLKHESCFDGTWPVWAGGTKRRLSHHLCIECFSQLSFDLEVYTKSAAVADFVYTSESNESCEKHSTQRW